MNYIVSKSPVVRIDLMVDRKYAPQLVSYIQRMGCTYKEERETNPGTGIIYKVFKDLHSTSGAKLGELLGLFYSLEWGNVVEGEPEGKFYIILNTRRKGKKDNAGENRKKAHEGSNGPVRGGTADNSGSGQVAEPAGDRINTGDACVDDPWEHPGEPTTCDGRCE